MKNSRLVVPRTATILLLLLVMVSISACNAIPEPEVRNEEQAPEIADPTPEVTNEVGQDYTDVIDNPVSGGIMVLGNNQFTSIDYFGQSLGFIADSGGIEWVSDSAAGVTKKNIALATYDGLVLIDPEGQQQLSFAGSNPITSTDISRDGTKIAWVSEQMIESSFRVELWAANIDGSDAIRVYEITPEESLVNPTTFEIIGWTADSKLLFGTRAVGIGGYILYSGWINLYLFDPATEVTTDLYINDGSSNMCVNSISNGFTMAAVGCKTIQIQNLVTGSVVDFPAVTGQNFAGSAQFSPSHTLVAYSIGRGNPENEYSQLLIAPVDGSSAPAALDTIEGGYFLVLGWVDENTILYRSSSGLDGASAIWRVETDGRSKPFKIADGLFMGFIY